MMECDDYQVDFKIKKDRGIGIEFVRGKSKCISVYGGKFPREAKLNISSWEGMSAGAIHCYGKIVVSSLGFKVIKAGNGDYLKKDEVCYGNFVPEDVEGLEIEITRPVTQEDKLLENGKSFEAWDIGDPTNRFSNRKHLIESAKKVFKKVFDKGWVLKIKQSMKKHDDEGEYWVDYYKSIAKN